MVADTGPAIAAKAERLSVRTQLRHAAGLLTERFPRLVGVREAAGAGAVTFDGFPNAHHRQSNSTIPLELLTEELKQRGAAAGIFLHRATVPRLLGPCSPSEATNGG